MTTLIRTELAKLSTLRSTWVILVIAALVTPSIAALILATDKHLRGALSTVSEATFSLSALLAGILCATAFANEYKDRTITTTFVLVPERARVVVAKAIAGALAGAVLAVVATALCYGLSALWLQASNVPWPWSTGQLLHASAGNLALGAVLPIVGVAVGGITQSPGLAGSLVGLTWLGVSNILSAVFTFFKHYGITAAQTALTQPTGHHYYSFAGALGAALGVSALMLLSAVRRVRAADV